MSQPTSDIAASPDPAHCTPVRPDEERAAWRDEKRLIETLERIGKELAGELDQQKVVQAVTDEATALTGAQFGAFFYNVIGAGGEALMLYTLTGAPIEAFSRFGMPRNTPIFAPTFNGEGVVRLDDVTKDPRYGRMAPHHGMPAGHLPVRSYLAVPVISRSGEVIGGLFFGHEQVGVFSERHERIATGIAGWAAVALDNARLYSKALEAQASLAERARLAGFAAEVGAALTQAGSLREILGGCTESMVKNLGAAFARIWTLDDRGEVLELQASSGLHAHLDGPHARIPVGRYKIGLIAAERRPHLTNDVQKDPRIGDPDWARRERMVAFAGYPLLVESRLVGVMAMFAREPLAPVVLEAMGSVADEIALGVERLRGEAALRRSEERYRSLVTASAQIVWTANAAGEFVTEQPGWSAFTGQSAEEYRGNGWQEVVHPEDRERTLAIWKEALHERAACRMEYRTRDRAGLYRQMEVRVVPVLEADGSVREWVGVHTDVTERKRAEQRSAAKHAVTRVLAEAGSIHEMTPRLLEAIGSSLQWDLAALWLPEPHEGVLTCKGLWHRPALEGSAFVAQSQRGRFAAGEELAGEVWASRTARWLPSLAGAPNFPRGPAAAADGLNTGLSVPVLTGNELFGVLELFRREPYEPDAALLNLMQTLGSELGQFLQRKHAEEARDRALAEVAAERSRLHELLMRAPALIWLTKGAQHVYELVNLESRKLLGDRDVLGKPIREALPEYADTAYFELMDQVYASGQPYFGNEAQIWIDRQGTGSREPGYYNFVYQPVLDAGGRIDGILSIGVDVTEQVLARRQIEEKAEELARLTRALERSNRELDQFAYVASHDLKAPLRGIANLSQWIEEDLGEALGDESREHLNLLRGRVHRMESLIEGILRYSRAGRLHSRPELVDTGELCHEIADLLAPGPNVSLELAEDLPQFVTERLPLQQVLMNLLGNALKHAGSGGSESVKVRVGAVDAGDCFEFVVADTGPGIAPQFHERIWSIFQTLEARDKVEGAGIGLALVKKIVETRGGRAWVESDEGRGAAFHVLWPKDPEAGTERC